MRVLPDTRFASAWPSGPAYTNWYRDGNRFSSDGTRRTRLAGLNLVELGQQVLGHPDRCSVDQPAVEGHRAAPLRRGLLHRRDDPVRTVDQARVRGEHLVGQLDLRGVDRPLALVAEHGGAARG